MASSDAVASSVRVRNSASRVVLKATYKGVEFGEILGGAGHGHTARKRNLGRTR